MRSARGVASSHSSTRRHPPRCKQDIYSQQLRAHPPPFNPDPGERACSFVCAKKTVWLVVSRVRFSAFPGESSGSAPDFCVARRSEAKSGRAVTERTSLSVLLILLLLIEVDTNEEIDKYGKQQQGKNREKRSCARLINSYLLHWSLADTIQMPQFCGNHFSSFFKVCIYAQSQFLKKRTKE